MPLLRITLLLSLLWLSPIAASGESPVTYAPTLESLKQHPVPEWFHDAKFGIFVHWTMSCIPAYAPRTGTLTDVLRHHPTEVAKHVPYAEWYWNAMKFPDTPTAAYHREQYGDAPYTDFREPFEAGLNAWDPDTLAELAQAAGAKYLVLVTKHHDGYCLWPTGIENPHLPGWNSERDIVGELASAVRARGIRFGVYYSGGLDWTFNPEPIASAGDMFRSVPTSEEYRRYSHDQIRELIDRYQPSVLWNDIAYPPGPELFELFAYYYNTVPDGVVNDRWSQPEPTWEKAQALFFPKPAPHADFRTTEYTQLRSISEKKWEATRGIGHSFGYTRNEDPNDILTLEELVRSFVDGVSKNGNLLLNVGPAPDGSLIDTHAALLRSFGAWMETNGEALYGTRPWNTAEGSAFASSAVVPGDSAAAMPPEAAGLPVRFTRKDGTLYALVLGTPAAREFTIRPIPAAPASVRSLDGIPLSFTHTGDALSLTLAAPLPAAPACAFALELD